jgi:outer membrane lipoprotein-sorting protein
MAYKIYLLILLFGFSMLLSATDLDEFYNRARVNFDSISTLQADLAQTNEFAQSKTKLQSEGKLYYKPGYLLLDYTKPDIQKLIMKGNSVLIYDKSSKTVIRTTNSEGISNPLQIVDKYWATSKRELLSEDSLSVRIRLTPIKDENLKKLEVNFNRKNLMIADLVYWDKSANKVRFHFLNIRTGVVIPSSKWNFVPPKGTKVIQR